MVVAITQMPTTIKKRSAVSMIASLKIPNECSVHIQCFPENQHSSLPNEVCSDVLNDDLMELKDVSIEDFSDALMDEAKVGIDDWSDDIQVKPCLY